MAHLGSPALAPDGASAVFARAETDGGWDLWQIDLEGVRPQRLTRSGDAMYVRQLPDDDRLLVTSYSQPRQMSLLPRAGGPARALMTGVQAMTVDGNEAPGEGFGDVDPTGRWLTYVAPDPGRGNALYVRPLGGGRARQLAAQGALPRWSPDGRWIAYARDRSLRRGIYLVAADGGDEIRLTETGGWPIWWPDGGSLAYLAFDARGQQVIRRVEIPGGRALPGPAVSFQGVRQPFDI
ncbi:MAG: hypothetical protein AAF772_19765, partial [Acidobacteriota bacterium]